MARGFVVYYSIWALFATHLQKDLHLGLLMVGIRLVVANLVAFLASDFWGIVADIFGATLVDDHSGILIGILVAPIYLLTTDPAWIISGFTLQGCFAGATYGQNPSYLTERFPAEVRSTAAGFRYHQGAIWGGFVAPILTYFAINYNIGFAIPMLICIAALFGGVHHILCCSVRRPRAW